MNEKDNHLHRLFDAIFAEGRDIGCDSAEQHITNVSALALSHSEAEERYPALWQHLRFCADCRQLYAMVSDFDSAERAGLLPEPAATPPLPTITAKPTLQERWDDFKQALDSFTTSLIPFGGFQPSTAQAILRGDNQLTDPVEIEILDGKVSLELDKMANEENETRRDLICIYSSEDEQLSASFAGTEIWLESAETGTIVSCVDLDSDGEATFEYIEPGDYILHWWMAQRPMKMPNINID